MSNDPFFSIIVPTRERKRTLPYTLRSILAQDHPSFEIIVSDNFSFDGTEQAVKDLADDRIRYFNTQARLPMHENWNFALGKAQGKYVTIIGDDDGLLPGALSDIASLIDGNNTKAISWNKIEYCWPDHPRQSLRNQLSVTLDNSLFRPESDQIIRDVCWFLLPYARMPTLYNSVLSMEVIRSCLLPDGRLFKSSSPDIYSGISLLGKMDSYLYSMRPFSINGASAASNGTALANNDNQAAYNTFVSELENEYRYIFGRIPGSVTAEALEALLQANIHHFAGRLNIAKRMAIFKICAELGAIGGARYAEGMLKVEAASKQCGLHNVFKIARLFSKPKTQNEIAPGPSVSSNALTLNVSRFNVNDVFSAAEFSAALLGPYKQPSKIHQYSLANRIGSVMRRKLFSRGQTGTPSL
jgi:glycosyltransferase involved in cell wall biosynthesis